MTINYIPIFYKLKFPSRAVLEETIEALSSSYYYIPICM